MGAAGSKLLTSSAITGNEFSKNEKAKELKGMSDALFQFMYSKWDIKEIFDITEKPGDYVIAISDLITSEFHVLGYTTKRNKIGEIYFQKWEKLDPPKSRDELVKMQTNTNVTRSARVKGILERRKERGISEQRGEANYKIHEQHAKIIAFYFVRIFQILGSLLLVVKDTEFPFLDERTGERISDTNYVRERAFAQQAQVVVPRFRPVAAPIAQQQRGGAETYFDVNQPLGPYEFIRKYLRGIDQEVVKKYKDEYNLDLGLDPKLYRFSKSYNLFFEYTPPRELPPMIIAGGKGSIQRFAMFVNRRGVERPELIYVDVNISKIDAPPQSLMDYKPPSSFNKEEQYNRYPFKVRMESKHSQIVDMDAEFMKTDTVGGPDQSYKNGVKYSLTGGKLYDILLGTLNIGEEFEQCLENFVIKAIAKQRGDIYYKYALSEKEKERSTRNSKSAAPANPGLAETFKELDNTETKKHVPHCIARALDLLDAASISNLKGASKAETRICSTDINGPGSKYIPLKAVGQLFGKLKANEVINVDEAEFNKALTVLDAFVGKESKVLTVSELNGVNQAGEANSLSEAIQRLARAFKSSKESGLNGFDDINFYKPASCTPGKKEPEYFDKSRAIFQNLQGYSQKLLAYHLNNVINISKFLKTVFNVSQRSDGSWKVEGPKTELLFAGFNVLDELTDQARHLLVDYYSGCEELYQKGVTEWENDVTNAPVAAPVPAAVPAAVPVAAAVPMDNTQVPSGPI